MSEIGADTARPRMTHTAAVASLALLVQSCAATSSTVRTESGPGGSQVAHKDQRIQCLTALDVGVSVQWVDPEAIPAGCHTLRLPPDYTRRLSPAPISGEPPAADHAAVRAGGLARLPAMDAGSASAARHVDRQIRDFRRNCPGEVIAIDVRQAPLSRTVKARLVALTLPHGGGCFGNKGEVDYLVVRHGRGWQTELEGLLAIGKTRHGGFLDVERQEAGLSRRTFSWTGSRYVAFAARGC